MSLEIDIQKTFSDFQLRIEGTIGEGITGIFGPSASGKSTLLNCVAGFEKPDNGRISLNLQTLFSSRDKINISAEKRRIGYVHQHSALFPHLSVRENVEFGYLLTAESKRSVDLLEMIHLFRLETIMDRGVLNLSGGERQRVALVRSLAASPDLLLLDEPLASLDLPFRGFILKKLKEVSGNLDLNMVYVSHSISEMMALVNSIIVINNGEKVAEGDPALLLSNARVADYVDYGSLENILQGTVVEHLDDFLSVLSIGDGKEDAKFFIPKLALEIGETIDVSINASDIIVSKNFPVAISAKNILKGTVSQINNSTNYAFLHCDIGGTRLITALTGHSVIDLELEEGNDIYLILKATSITPIK